MLTIDVAETVCIVAIIAHITMHVEYSLFSSIIPLPFIFKLFLLRMQKYGMEPHIIRYGHIVDIR